MQGGSQKRKWQPQRKEEGSGQGKLHNKIALDLSLKNSEETAQAKAWKCDTV